MNDEEIERRYTYHAPDSATRELHDNFRTHERWYAKAINDIPGGDTREKSLAFTALEEMSFWTHAHIARNLHPKENTV